MTASRTALLIAAALVIAAPAAAQGRPAAPAPAASANKIAPIGRTFPFLDRFYRIPAAERSLFRLAYRIRVGGRPFTGRMWFVDPAGARSPAPLAADGEVRRLPTSQMLSTRGWRVEVEAPASTEFGVNMELEPTLRPSTELPAATLVQTITQSNRAIRSAAGVARFAAPTMTRIVFTGVRGAEAVLADGRAVPLPMLNGAASFTPAALPNARTVRFAQAPERMLIAPAARRQRRD